MLNKVIKFSIKNKFLIGIFTVALIVTGIFSATRLPIDALPDITNNQVQIITTSPSLATQEVEQFITYPIELELKSIPGIVELRSVSRFGLSLVTVVFEEDIDIYWGRTQINERLKAAQENIPPGFGTPFLAPVSTGLGEILQYVVSAKPGYEDQYDAMELRSIQDWLIIPQLLGTPGVAEVNTLGGRLKEYEVAVVPDKMKSMDVTMTEIFNALEVNNENTGGAYIDKKPNAYYIRGVGMISELEEIKKIVIKVQNEIPILIRDVAEVRFGSAIRYGATTKNGQGEVVSGMVMMLRGENSAQVVADVKEQMDQIRKTLPEGIEITPFLDRTKLVNNAIATVEKNLIEGALIVIFILVLLIGNWRAGLIVASVIPLALLFAITLMNLFGVSGNLMSLGAIDFGLIVDGAVIIVEAIIHGLHQIKSKSKLSRKEMDEEVYEASSKIRTSAAFGEIIILIVYLPILVLAGIEGKMFVPMAQTVSFAILGAFILSLTYVPMMSALFLSRKTKHKRNVSDRIIDFLNRYYQKILKGAMQIKGIVVSVAVLLFVGAFMLFQQLGGEFIPQLDEGDVATHIIIPPGSSLEQEIATTTKAEKLLVEHFPEIEQVVSKIGSAEVPTDPMPMEVADMMVILKPPHEWTTATNKPELIEKMDQVLSDLPGVTTEFSQPIQMRFNELMTGIRSDVGIKIFGEDLDLLVGYGDRVVELINQVDGVVDARAETVSGLPQLSVNYDKDKLALYGLNVGDLNRLIRTGFAGEKAGIVYEGERRFDLVVRFQKQSRQSIEDLKNMYISLPSGSQIPLSTVAEIKLERGPAQISREKGKRRVIIGFNVRNRDVQSVVDDIQRLISKNIDMPTGYYIEYAGQFENLVAANKRLAIAVPIALSIIMILLYFTFKNIKQSLLIFTAVPLSAIGGVLALWWRDMPFSISAGVGFIALFGVAVLNGIVLIGYFNQLKKEGMKDINERIVEGTKVRLRPVIMTAAVASLGFLPMALSTSAGAEVQKPLATVVIGGLVSATLLTLIVLPILYYFIETGIKLNKKINALLIILGISIGFNHISFAQNGMNEAVQIGLENNQSIKIATLNIQRQEQLAKAGYDIPATSITGSFGQLNTVNFDQNFSISQRFNPSVYLAKRHLMQSKVDEEIIRQEIAKQELVLEIRTTYNELVYAKHLQSILQIHDSIYQEFAKKAALKYDLGESNLIEKSTAELNLQQSNQRLRQIATTIAITDQYLQRLLNSPTYYEIAEFQLQKASFDLRVDSSEIVNNPLLNLINQEIISAERSVKASRANYFPEIAAGYFIQSFKGEQLVDNQPVIFDGTPQFQGFSVGVSIPLFYGHVKGNTAAARIQHETQEEQAAYTRKILLQKLAAQLAEIAQNAQEIDYYEQHALPNATLILEKARKGYATGEVSYLELGKAMELNNEMNTAHIAAIRKYNQGVYTIKYLVNQ